MALDTQVLCNTCFDHYTLNDDKECSYCKTGNKSEFGTVWDQLMQRFVLPNPIEFPLPPETHLPCMDHIRTYDMGWVTPKVRALCGSCPAKQWCLDVALANPHHCLGIWGGTSTNQRRKMLKLADEPEEEGGLCKSEYVLIA